MNDKISDTIFFLVIVILLITIAQIAIHNSLKRKKWLEQNCKIIGEISPSSSVGMGISSNGSLAMVPVFIPGKTGYQCNDGKKYWE